MFGLISVIIIIIIIIATRKNSEEDVFSNNPDYLYMAEKRLGDYKIRGYSDNEIRKIFIGMGWTNEQFDYLLKNYSGS